MGDLLDAAAECPRCDALAANRAKQKPRDGVVLLLGHNVNWRMGLPATHRWTEHFNATANAEHDAAAGELRHNVELTGAAPHGQQTKLQETEK